MSKYELNDILSLVLRLGVVISLVLLVAGVILVFTPGGSGSYSISQITNYKSTGAQSSTLNSSSIPLSGIVNGIVHFNGVYYITLGLWVLIFTPISIVLIALLDFLIERNKLYIVLTLIVLFDLFFAMLVVPMLFHV